MRKRFCRKRPALFKSGQWHFQQDNAPVYNSILVTDYLTKMGIKTVRHPPNSLDLMTFGYPLSSETVVMRQLRRWKRLWRRSLTRSHKRCPWCNGYRRRKCTRRHEFKSWTRLIAFHIALIPLGKVWIQLFSLQLWVNSRAD